MSLIRFLQVYYQLIYTVYTYVALGNRNCFAKPISCTASSNISKSIQLLLIDLFI